MLDTNDDAADPVEVADSVADPVVLGILEAVRVTP
jgi:hypothetical protein